MKKGKSLLLLLVAILFTFIFTGQGLAAEGFKVIKGEDGRIQMLLEFDDVDQAAWALGYIGKMKSKNIVKGYPDGTFKPNQPVKRIEAIVMAVRLMGLEEETKAKSLDTKLHFKDAEIIDKKYQWAKGHIIVALENGLFDATEAAIMPEQPASRIWVTGLLVRALGLQSEAFSKMTDIPDFRDAHAIPAGAVGYVNVAVEHGLINGYPDNTFRPDKSVTRAEIAALMDRTNEKLLENRGAITVKGVVTNIDFDTVGNKVYSDGTITIESFTGDSLSYAISSDLMVQYHERFIPADQLLVGNVITLVVQNGAVVEATLVDNEDATNEIVAKVLEFKVKVELANEHEYQWKYKSKGNMVEAEIEKETVQGKRKVTGEEARVILEDLLERLSLSPDMTKEEITSKVLDTLEIKGAFKELEIKIKFSNSKKVEIELENEEEIEEIFNEAHFGIREFKLKIKLINGSELKHEYKHEEGEIEAEIEEKTTEGKKKYKGHEAIAEIESLLERLGLIAEITEEELVEKVLGTLNIETDQIKELKIKLKFMNGTELEVERKNEIEENEED